MGVSLGLQLDQHQPSGSGSGHQDISQQLWWGGRVKGARQLTWEHCDP